MVVGGRFHVQAPIARDGLVHVWAATDRTTGAMVALQVIAPAWSADDEAVAAFAGAAGRAAALAHPSLVDALATGVLADGRPWLAAPWIDGRTVRAILEAE